MTEYRASFDAAISFSNGGDLTARGFRVDVPGPDIDEAGIAALFVASLGLTREASRARYAPGTEFAFGRLTLVGNTGTYLDAPYHRFADGADLSAIPLERTAELPAVVVRMAGTRQRGIDVGALAALEVSGKAVLLHTGDDARFGSPAYAEDRHFLTRAGAWFTAVPLRVEGLGTIPVRAFARLP